MLPFLRLTGTESIMLLDRTSVVRFVRAPSSTGRVDSLLSDASSTWIAIKDANRGLRAVNWFDSNGNSLKAVRFPMDAGSDVNLL